MLCIGENLGRNSSVVTTHEEVLFWEVAIDTCSFVEWVNHMGVACTFPNRFLFEDPIQD